MKFTLSILIGSASLALACGGSGHSTAGTGGTATGKGGTHSGGTGGATGGTGGGATGGTGGGATGGTGGATTGGTGGMAGAAAGGAGGGATGGTGGTGTGGSATGGQGGTTGGTCGLIDPQKSDPYCVACVSAHCCSEASTCGANAECVSIYQCAASCTTLICMQEACESPHVAGATAYEAFRACLLAQCPTDCPSGGLSQELQ